MRRGARHLLALGAALAAAVCLPAAGAASPAAGAAQSSTSATLFAIGGTGGPVTVVEVPARITGYIAVSFHGDPATGCAIRGLCGYTGTVLWAPSSAGALQILETRSHGHRHDDVYLELSNPTAGPDTGNGVTHAEVQLTPGAGGQPPASCADVASGGVSIALAQRQGRVSFSLAAMDPSPFQTRCAGPLMADLAPALAAPTETLRAVRRGAITLDLTGSRGFASHGFAGTANSTLAIALGHPHRPQRLSSTSPGPTAVREREVQVDYRAGLAGAVSAAVRGDGDPALCGPLGACGLHGALSVLPAAGAGTASLQALGPARRPTRDFLTALGLSHGGNVRGIRVDGAVTWSHGGLVSADLGQGLVSCRDTAGLGGGLVILSSAHGRLSAAYTAAASSDGGLRTRCPGPLQSSLAPLASGSAPLSLLSQRTTRLALDRGAPLLDDGYGGASRPHLTLTLTRERTRTLLFGAPPGLL